MPKSEGKEGRGKGSGKKKRGEWGFSGEGLQRWISILEAGLFAFARG